MADPAPVEIVVDNLPPPEVEPATYELRFGWMLWVFPLSSRYARNHNFDETVEKGVATALMCLDAIWIILLALIALPIVLVLAVLLLVVVIVVVILAIVAIILIIIAATILLVFGTAAALIIFVLGVIYAVIRMLHRLTNGVSTYILCCPCIAVALLVAACFLGIALFVL